MSTKQKGLGRGLDALLDSDGTGTAPVERLATLKLDQLGPGRYQPRTKMDEASLQELAASIKAQGLMQPILVRPVTKDRYEIIAGERRWRAAKLAGLSEVPVVVRDVPDQAALAMALIENIQREDLNPLEEAQGVQRLVKEFKLTHQEAADAIGRSRTATTNLLRLLNLERSVQQRMLEGQIDMGHARALLSLEGRRQEEVAKRVAEHGLSVRETEKLVNDILNPRVRGKVRRARTDRDVARLEEDLSEELGTTVEIRQDRKGSGKLVIRYTSNEHLESLLLRLKRQ
ncbi:MAG: chromosome partitioning protein ParB [Acidobacteria bacterium RIFCSPLOWO2_02_FULL_59_13]|nr:MAG: chromosome partitioning protein ParB [Acidobacteria bacterium RIFCSPLOWO2_02_FULL_59_13]